MEITTPEITETEITTPEVMEITINLEYVPAVIITGGGNEDHRNRKQLRKQHMVGPDTHAIWRRGQRIWMAGTGKTGEGKKERSRE